MSGREDLWHADDAVVYMRSHPEAGVIYDRVHGWWVTTEINDEHHPLAFRIKGDEADRIREHAALEKLDPSPHPDREIWVLRQMP